MKKLYFVIWTVCLLLAFQKASGQDFHLSQYDAAPLFVNPALTGNYFDVDEDFRVNSGYRSQWKSLGQKPFVTAYLSYDMQVDRFGAGAFLINNRSGSGDFNSFSFFASGSYRVTEKASEHQILTGLQLGLFHKSFDPGIYTYDSQYSESTGGFDPSMNSGEAFSRESKLNFDANVGVFYRYLDESKKVSPYVGATVFHATMPNESFTAEKSQLPMRFLVNAGAAWDATEQLIIEPVALFMTQAKAREINAGVRGWYNMKDTPYSFLLGADYRVKDAVVFHTGIRYYNHIIRVSYDYNISYLKTFTNGRGGLELSLILMGSKGQPIIRSPKF